eukprot:6210888-Pleurochrysis_carterae.AAC.1
MTKGVCASVFTYIQHSYGAPAFCLCDNSNLAVVACMASCVSLRLARMTLITPWRVPLSQKLNNSRNASTA